MGPIEQTIFANYKKALDLGDLDQARRATELAKFFKQNLEKQGFIDYPHKSVLTSSPPANYLKPTPYKYSYLSGVVFLNCRSLSLTTQENSLFQLFSQHESSLEQTNLITPQMITHHLYPEKLITESAIRLSIHRLRRKVEANPHSPKIILNVYRKGYLFWAKRQY